MKLLRSKSYWVVVQSEGGLRGGTRFEMKYKPQAESITGREEATTFGSGIPIIECFFFLCSILSGLLILVPRYLFVKTIHPQAIVAVRELV